jgi:hypothetical protein
MAKPRPWTPASHGPLTEIAAGLWIVDATLAILPIGRRMTIARAGDGGLIVHSAVACDDPTMAAIDALGPVRTIVVPSRHHCLDAPAYKARYPDAKVLAMPASQRRVAERVAVDGDYGSLPGGALSFEPLAGLPQEAVLVHRADDGGETLVFNDAFMNLPDRLPGVKGWLVKLIGSTGGPKVTWTARVALVEDKPAYAATLRALAARPALRRIVPGHGDLITDDAGAKLAGAADRLHRA